MIDTIETIMIELKQRRDWNNPQEVEVWFEEKLREVRAEAKAEIRITANDLVKLESLRRLCIDDDLLDLDSYDSMGRSGEISNAWEALQVIEKLTKKGQL